MNKIVKKYMIMIVGIILVSLANEYFWIPNNIVSGGVVGLSVVISHYIPGFSVEIFMFAANVVLLILAYILIGRKFAANTVAGSLGISGAMWIIKTFLDPQAVTSDMVLNVLFGTIIGGSGLALVFMQDASTGGTDIVAKILNKYLKADIGRCLQTVDGLVVLLGGITFGLQGAMYSILIVLLNGTIIDKVISGFNSCKMMTIMTQKDELVSEYIMHEIKRGCTIIPSMGAYTKEACNIIYCAVDRKQFVRIKAFLKENDPNAFIIVSDAHEVLGRGFAQI